MLIKSEMVVLSSALYVFGSDAPIMVECWMKYLPQNQSTLNV